MARKTVKFELGHRNFKTKQFSAFRAYEVMFGDESDDMSPEDLLQDTLIETEPGVWLELDSKDAINSQIFHPVDMESPLSMLTRLIAKVKSIGCGAMYEWDHVKVP